MKNSILIFFIFIGYSASSFATTRGGNSPTNPKNKQSSNTRNANANKPRPAPPNPANNAAKKGNKNKLKGAAPSSPPKPETALPPALPMFGL